MKDYLIAHLGVPLTLQNFTGEIAKMTTPSKGRTPGAKTTVFKKLELSTHHILACTAFAAGIEPLRAYKQYMPDEAALPRKADAALRMFAKIFEEIARICSAQSKSEPQVRATALLNTASLLSAAATDCLKLIDSARAKVASTRTSVIEAMIKEAADAKKMPLLKETDLLFVRSEFRQTPLPSPTLESELPSHFQSREAYRDHLYKSNTDIEYFDEDEIDAQIEEGLIVWFDSQGVHYKPNFNRSYSSGLKFPNPVSAAIRAKEDQLNEILRLPEVRRVPLENTMRGLSWTIKRHPAITDSVAMWFASPTLDSLHDNELFALSSIEDMIMRSGQNWHKGLRNMGEARAQRISNWLYQVKPTGTRLRGGELVSVKERRAKEALVYTKHIPPALLRLGLDPLVEYIGDEVLNGKHGEFRAKDRPNLARAENDIDALVAVLEKYISKPKTLAVYSREIARFCLWLYREKRTALSSASVIDAREYQVFLGNIPSEWLTAHGDPVPRGSAEWRPFRGQLDPISQRKALSAISSVMAQLFNLGYLTGNVMAGVTKDAALPSPRIDASRSLPRSMWQMVVDKTEAELELARANVNKPRGLQKLAQAVRLRALVQFLLTTGVRREEAANAKTNKIDVVRVDGEIGFLLEVTGKRKNVRKVPISQDVIDLITDHHKATFGHIDPPDKGWPLFVAANSPFDLQKKDQPRPMSAESMYRHIKDIFKRCADEIEGAERTHLLNASTHWLRHTFGHELADQGTNPRSIQRAMGHRHIGTTEIYTKNSDQEMLRDVRKAQRKALAKAGQKKIAGVEAQKIEGDI